MDKPHQLANMKRCAIQSEYTATAAFPSHGRRDDAHRDLATIAMRIF